jgi:microcystin-dependent protein
LEVDVSDPFLGEVKIISWNFPPKGWAFCNGQLLPINQNQALFSILGTTYGGNGQTNFGLPNLQGRAPIYQGQGFTLGQIGGEENHTLTLQEMPAHNHFVQGTSITADQNNPASNALAASSGFQLYTAQITSLTPLDPSTITNSVGGQPHSNLQPYLVLNFIIALQGIFPSRN